MRFHVVRSALDFDFSTCVAGVHARARICDADNAGNGVGAHIALDVRYAHVSGSGRHAEVASDIAGGNRSACGGEVGIAIDFFDADRAGGGAHVYGTGYIADGLGAGRDSGADFSFVRNLDGVSDADVAHARHIFTDANRVAFLLDGRIRDGVVQPLLRIVEAESRGAHFAAHVHFAVGAAGDVHLTGGVGQF